MVYLFTIKVNVMKEYNVRIGLRGIAPLRQNRLFSQSVGDGKKKTEEDRRKEGWERSYRIPDGKGGFIYYVPTRALKKVAVLGSTGLKIGKKGVPKLMAALYFPQWEPPAAIVGSEPQLVHDFVRIPPGPKGVMIEKWWVAFEKWYIEFIGTVFTTVELFPPSILESAYKEAGVLRGLLDGRPDLGRFQVEKFELL